MMSRSWSEAVNAILELVVARTGWEFPPTRWINAEVSIRQTMHEAKVSQEVSQIEDFVRILRLDEQALDGLIERLLIYESYFFRDRQHFQLIREHWAQAMLQDPGRPRAYRLWSAGCASGEEPYSLAIVIKELGWTESTSILATDISRSALGLARQAIYTHWSLRESSSSFIANYFRPTDDGRFALNAAIRDMVKLDYLNLSSDSYPARANDTQGLDLILCRNVAIYLAQPTLRELGRRLFASLTEGGWLILGPSDPLLDEYAPFEIRELNGILVHKRPAATALRILPPAQSLVSGEAVAAVPVAAVPVAGSQAVSAVAAPIETEIASAAQERDEIQELTRQIRVLADNNRFDAAEAAVLAARARHPVATEFIFLHMIILLGLQRHEETAKLAEQLIYLDRQLAIAHFFRGSSLRAIGDVEGARRAFENALRICAERPAHEPVTFSEGESHVRLGQAAASQLAQLSGPDAVKHKVRK